MRYAEGGGLTAEGRARREDVRLQAARLFEQDMDTRRIARILRVSTKSARVFILVLACYLTLLPAGSLAGLVALDGIAHVMWPAAGSSTPGGRPGPGLPGFGCWWSPPGRARAVSRRAGTRRRAGPAGRSCRVRVLAP